MNAMQKVYSFDDYKNNQQAVQNKIYSMKEGKNMDDILKTYIEKVDRDQSDLREDIRESERRTAENISKTEQRMDKRLDRIEEMIKEQGKEIQDVKQELNDSMRENRKFMWGIAITIFLSVVGSVGVIIATYMSTISLLKDMIPK